MYFSLYQLLEQGKSREPELGSHIRTKSNAKAVNIIKSKERRKKVMYMQMMRYNSLTKNNL